MQEKAKQKTYEKDLGGATLQNGRIVRIPATRNYMFKNVFGVHGKEENLKGLLEAILKVKIESLEIQNPELPRNHPKAKLGILDIRTQLADGTIASIEMQVKNNANIGERMTFYVCKLYINTIEIGEQYEKMNKTIAIAITNFSYFNRKEYHQIANLKFEECKDKNEIVEEILQGEESQLVTDKLELHIIDLEKFRKIKNPKGELADWLNFMLGNEEGIAMAIKRNKAIEKANEDNKRLSGDRKMQEMYLSEQMDLYDRNDMIAVAEGKGERRKQLEIAKKLLNKGMPIEEIEEVTALSKEEIEKL